MNKDRTWWFKRYDVADCFFHWGGESDTLFLPWTMERCLKVNVVEKQLWTAQIWTIEILFSLPVRSDQDLTVDTTQKEMLSKLSDLQFLHIRKVDVIYTAKPLKRPQKKKKNATKSVIKITIFQVLCFMYALCEEQTNLISWENITNEIVQISHQFPKAENSNELPWDCVEQTDIFYAFC